MTMMMNPTKTNNPFLSYFFLFVWGFVLMEVSLGQNPTSEIKVGVVLDLQTTFSKICLTSINMSLSDFYEDHPNYRTRLALHVRDSMEDTVEASAAALDLIKNEQVRAIIGPINSMQAEFMIRLANKSQVPTITFSATSPLLTSINSPYFVRATVDDSSHVKAIASIVKSFGWRSVVAIYADNELGEGILPYLFDALQEVEVLKSVISLEANDDKIRIELYKLMTRQTRVFVVHMASSIRIRVFQIAREIGMMDEGYVWLLSNEMTPMMRHSLGTMQGVLGLRSHVPNSQELEDFRSRWERKFEKENPLMEGNAELNVFALWAYDSITALAMAVENSTQSLSYVNASASTNNRTDLGNLGVSRYGPSLLKSLSDVRFKGLAGEFKLINRQLESSTFEIINVIENEERFVGFWTPSNGFVNPNSNTSFIGEKFGPVIWPGKPRVIPKGWDIPTKGKKITVGVPVRRGFLNFVEVKTDPSNATTPKGFSIEIFEAALKKLRHSVIPQYIPLGSFDEDYTDLVCQANNVTWDALVGDVTIREDRSLCADFTLPYTESGVYMLVPTRDNENNTWVFLKPWSVDLWVTTGCFFVLIGFVVWLFEHRVNTDFGGQLHHQIGTSLWFSFSTMVFAHREMVVSNLSRFVVVVWCFVVLVLTQSYTANLASLLTVQRLQPAVTNVKDLIRNRDSVGYQKSAFVYDILIKEGFDQLQLKPFESAEQCIQLLSNGSIAAAFDEVAYLRDIFSHLPNSSKYAMVETSFKSAGFGFAFRKNSPLTEDFSRAILSMTEADEMKDIENKWFPKQINSSDPTNALSSNRLNLASFWGLFLIAGIASFCAFLVFVALFLHEHRHMLRDDSGGSLWRKLTSLFRIFDEKDTKSHSFKNSAVHNMSSPITQSTPSHSSVEIRPWPRSMSLNREIELRRFSFVVSEERFKTPPIHDGESDIESGAER